MSQRHWLRPRMYVQDLGGGLTVETAWRPNDPIPDEEWVCATCGRYLLNDDGEGGGYHLPSGIYCYDCHSPVGLTGWRRKLQNADIWLDNAYYRYARRYGRRVSF